MTAKNHAPKWMDVYEEVHNTTTYERYIYETFNGPTPYDAIPGPDSFSVVDWYWDDIDQRHYTGLDTVEQWYTRQERIRNGWVDELDTNGNEPVKSNMEAQLRQAEMYNFSSFHAESFMKLVCDFDYRLFIERWQEIQHAKLKKEVKELATRDLVQVFANDGKLLSFKEFVQKANEQANKAKARTTRKRRSINTKAKGKGKGQVQSVRKPTVKRSKVSRSTRASQPGVSARKRSPTKS